jgi:UDP-N-acetylmuramate dehydrogenase
MTTLGVGGLARFFVEAEGESALVDAFDWAAARGVPTLVLGGGSNVLVADEGYPGLVVRIALGGVRIDDDEATVVAGAGVSWDVLVELAVERGLAGVECLSGIPGRVGATPIQNVGAYGQEVAETISRVRVFEIESGRLEEITGDECEFGYRDSRFKRRDRGKFVVTSVTFRLRPGGEPALRYPELVRELAPVDRPSLAAVRAAVIAIRRRKSMVLDPTDPDARSAGSFFMNPIVSEAVARAIGLDGMPRYAAAGGVKLSAAWLIERAGFARGTVRGAAGISTKHALAIVNRGGAGASDVVALAREIRDGVRERFGVTLVPEPVLVGIDF